MTDDSTHIQTRSGASSDAPDYITLDSPSPRRPQAMLKELRLKLCYGQRELAALSGIDQAQLSRVEAGSDALFSTYEKLAAALGGTLVLRVAYPSPWSQVLEKRLSERNARWESDWEQRRAARRRSR